MSLTAITIGIMIGAAAGFAVGVFACALFVVDKTSQVERAAFLEGRDMAIANAAMKAYDMGHPDVHLAINGLLEKRQ